METLLAVGTLGVGMLFIGGTFMTGVYFSTVSTERTIASVAADEAFAKINLYRLDPNAVDADRLYNLAASIADPNFVVCEWVNRAISSAEMLYPSTVDTSASQYSWAAVCRRLPMVSGSNPGKNTSRLVQVMVFVSRKAGSNTQFRQRSQTGSLSSSSWPRPMPLLLETDPNKLGPRTLGSDELILRDFWSTDSVVDWTVINDGVVIVDDRSGQTYRVVERYRDQPDRIRLDRPWQGGTLERRGHWIWVVPGPAAGGRDPLVAIYQKTFRF